MSGRIDFGLTLQTDPPAWRLVELFRRAEELGFTHAWTFDSHILWQEPYVIHSQILSATERMMVGPLVTNPATRDPSVTASVFATLNDMFGNRTVCGIGRGDSALRVLGRRPTTLAQTERAIREIRDLAEGRPIAGANGDEVRIPWVRDGRLGTVLGRELVLQPAAVARRAEADDEIDDGDDEIGLVVEAEPLRIGGGRAGGIQEVENADDGEQGGGEQEAGALPSGTAAAGSARAVAASRR